MSSRSPRHVSQRSPERSSPRRRSAPNSAERRVRHNSMRASVGGSQKTVRFADSLGVSARSIVARENARDVEDITGQNQLVTQVGDVKSTLNRENALAMVAIEEKRKFEQMLLAERQHLADTSLRQNLSAAALRSKESVQDTEVEGLKRRLQAQKRTQDNIEAQVQKDFEEQLEKRKKNHEESEAIAQLRIQQMNQLRKETEDHHFNEMRHLQLVHDRELMLMRQEYAQKAAALKKRTRSEQTRLKQECHKRYEDSVTEARVTADTQLAELVKTHTRAMDVTHDQQKSYEMETEVLINSLQGELDELRELHNRDQNQLKNLLQQGKDMEEPARKATQKLLQLRQEYQKATEERDELNEINERIERAEDAISKQNRFKERIDRRHHDVKMETDDLSSRLQNALLEVSRISQNPTTLAPHLNQAPMVHQQPPTMPVDPTMTGPIPGVTSMPGVGFGYNTAGPTAAANTDAARLFDSLMARQPPPPPPSEPASNVGHDTNVLGESTGSSSTTTTTDSASIRPPSAGPKAKAEGVSVAAEQFQRIDEMARSQQGLFDSIQAQTSQIDQARLSMEQAFERRLQAVKASRSRVRAAFDAPEPPLAPGDRVIIANQPKTTPGESQRGQGNPSPATPNTGGGGGTTPKGVVAAATPAASSTVSDEYSNDFDSYDDDFESESASHSQVGGSVRSVRSFKSARSARSRRSNRSQTRDRTRMTPPRHPQTSTAPGSGSSEISSVYTGIESELSTATDGAAAMGAGTNANGVRPGVNDTTYTDWEQSMVSVADEQTFGGASQVHRSAAARVPSFQEESIRTALESSREQEYTMDGFEITEDLSET